MNILFGLHGGIGNAIFCLPAIKALSRENKVSLYVQGDYPMKDLFARCSFIEAAAGPEDHLPPHDMLMCGQYAPANFRGHRHSICGFPSVSVYSHPEWLQVLIRATGDRNRVDVTKWIKPAPIIAGTRVEWDFGFVAGCKPGSEWERKKYPLMPAVAVELAAMGHRVAVFGKHEDSDDKFPGDDLRDGFHLEDLPEQLRACRVIVGTDSGITHLASSLGVPCVFVFTATSHVKGEPVGPMDRNRIVSLNVPCAPCQSTPRWKECKQWVCREIPVGRVVAEALALFNSTFPK